MGKYEELGKILLADNTIKKSMKFGQIKPSCPAFESRMVFVDEKKKKEWDELDSSVKKSVVAHLRETTKCMEQSLAIDFLCLVIQDLIKRIEKLEELT